MDTTRRNGGVLVEFQPMSPEEVERTMQFLLNQQAQFAADFERLSTKTERIADGVIGLTGIVGRLIESQQETGQQVKETMAGISELREQHQVVEANLNALILMFERHLREDHDGRPS